MSDQPGYQRGDRIALDYTADPHTRLQPGDEGTVTSYDPPPWPAERPLGQRQHPGHAPG